MAGQAPARAAAGAGATSWSRHYLPCHFLCLQDVLRREAALCPAAGRAPIRVAAAPAVSAHSGGRPDQVARALPPVPRVRRPAHCGTLVVGWELWCNRPASRGPTCLPFPIACSTCRPDPPMCLLLAARPCPSLPPACSEIEAIF
jgi:hypothetical protein